VTSAAKSKRNTQELLWCGLFHFAVDSNCKFHYLRGAKGGYVNAVSCAGATSDFIARVFQALCDRQLTLIDSSQVKSFTPSDPNENLSQEWTELSQKALASGEVEFTEFQLYDEGSSCVQE
jgi:hypothetical protein